VKADLLVPAARAQDFAVLYNRKFDVTARGGPNPLYRPKFEFESPHTLALDRVPPRAKILDIGCASGYLARALRQKGCEVTGVDLYPPPDATELVRFIQADLSTGDLPVDAGAFDYVLLLDVVEHLRSPEALMDSLRHLRADRATPTLIVSTGNIAFLPVRLMLLLGAFHYGPRGILDLTHTRLFTFRSRRDLLEQAGFQVEETRGVPAPFPLALGDSAATRVLLLFNQALIRIWRSLFSYQIFMTAKPLPTLDYLLTSALETSRSRAEASGSK
jgi:2-polyprenyl-3-methyl-5-hydroxy-6-metoxy-1,4-benzoquinol methylase